jgi:phosphatidylserine decarboxylase
MKGHLFVLLQYFIPQHLLSRLTGKFANCSISWIKNSLINLFIKYFDVNMQEAERETANQYKNFNDFFTRELKTTARSIIKNESNIICPVDGTISQLGTVEQGRIYQAKKHYFSLLELLGGQGSNAEHFTQGKYATIYLSPKDYHRVHMPIDGKLKSMTYIPGRLFSVNQSTTEYLPGLFAKNERMVALFDTKIGPTAVIMIGAMIVAGIETVWSGQITPPARKIKHTIYDEKPEKIYLNQGDELGRFMLGSTVIMLFSNSALTWPEDIRPDINVLMGQSFAKIN